MLFRLILILPEKNTEKNSEDVAFFLRSGAGLRTKSEDAKDTEQSCQKILRV